MLTADDYYEIRQELIDVQRRVWEIADHLDRLEPEAIECIRGLREAADKLSADINDARNKVVQMFEEACNEQ